MNGEIEWPREIWMAERDEHDQGVVSAVLSEHATVARFEGDTERERDFHRYVDVDIYETAERYWKDRVAAAHEAAANIVERAGHSLHVEIRDLTPDNAKAALEAVRREALKDAAKRLMQMHREHMADLERDPDNYVSAYYTASIELRALIDKETTE